MKKLLFICCFIFSLYSYSQSNIEISLQQDARLLFVGDDKGNDPITVNLLSKVEIPVYNFSKNHLSTYLSVEYADLAGKNFKRYAIGAGYVINSVYRKIGAGAYIDFGKIYREKDDYNGFSLSGELSYKISNRLKAICTWQITQREDLKALYNCKEDYRVSGFFGLKYRI